MLVLADFPCVLSCRHNDVNKGETILSAQDTMQDPFSLKIRYFLGKMNILDAKISRKV